MKTSVLQKGISLLELLLSLVVITMLVLLAARYYIVASNNAKYADAAAKIDKVVNASYQWVQQRNGNFCLDKTLGEACKNSFSAKDLLDAHLITGADLINPWHPLTAAQCENQPLYQSECIGVGVLLDKPNTMVVGIFYLPEKVCKSLQQRYQNRSLNDNSWKYCEERFRMGYLFHAAF